MWLLHDSIIVKTSFTFVSSILDMTTFLLHNKQVINFFFFFLFYYSPFRGLMDRKDNNNFRYFS